MSRFAQLNEKIESCTTAREIVNVVELESETPPSEYDLIDEPPGRIYSDPGCGIDLFVMNVQNDTKVISWNKSTCIERDGYVIENQVKVTPSQSMLPNLVVSLCHTNSKYGYIDLKEGGPTQIDKFHRFIIYKKYDQKKSNNNENELSMPESNTKKAKLRAEALELYINDIHKMRKENEDDYDDWLIDTAKQSKYHICVGLLLGYTFSDIATFLLKNNLEW